jgi:iron-sulfur cluster repair protein YtfE (RIC family)
MQKHLTVEQVKEAVQQYLGDDVAEVDMTTQKKWCAIDHLTQYYHEVFDGLIVTVEP